MLVPVFELLTGMGLAASAGLNAWIPLLSVGLLARYTDLITLPPGWHWLSNGWTLAILAVLLVIEMVADKIPVVDHINDVLHTVIRPTSGGLVFGVASQSQTATVSDPGQFFTSHHWIPIAAGAVIALGVHGVKATARPVVNATTFGVGTPIVSLFEDVVSAIMSLVAIIVPVLIVLFLLFFVLFFWWAVRRRRRRREEKLAARMGQGVPVRPA
jgi:uncharacterized protein DUF4126